MPASMSGARQSRHLLHCAQSFCTARNGRQATAPAAARSIMYDAGTESESFEWYRVRGAPKSECRLMQQRIDILALPHPPAAAAPSAAPSRAPAAAAARRPGGRKGARALLRGLRCKQASAAGAPRGALRGRVLQGRGSSVRQHQWMLTEWAMREREMQRGAERCSAVSRVGPGSPAHPGAGRNGALLYNAAEADALFPVWTHDMQLSSSGLDGARAGAAAGTAPLKPCWGAPQARRPAAGAGAARTSALPRRATATERPRPVRRPAPRSFVLSPGCSAWAFWSMPSVLTPSQSRRELPLSAACRHAVSLSGYEGYGQAPQYAQPAAAPHAHRQYAVVSSDDEAAGYSPAGSF